MALRIFLGINLTHPQSNLLDNDLLTDLVRILDDHQPSQLDDG